MCEGKKKKKEEKMVDGIGMLQVTLTHLTQCWSFTKVVFWKDLRLWTAYTLEASFCGAGFGELENIHFRVEHFAVC